MSLPVETQSGGSGGDPNPQYNAIMRAPLARDRAHPFALRPYQVAHGSRPDPSNPGSYIYMNRRRYIGAISHAYGLDPGHDMPGPTAVGRMTFENKRWCPICLRPENEGGGLWNAGWPYVEMAHLMPNPNVVPPLEWRWECPECGHVEAARAAPPRFTPQFWAKFRLIDIPDSAVESCVGGKIERGAFVRGGFSLLPRTDEEGNPLPPHFLPWAFYSHEMTTVPDNPLPGDTMLGMHRDAENVADILEADQYTCLVLYPVWPDAAWPTAYHANIPYPAGAENDFAFNDAFNEEFPCNPRQTPYRHIDPQSSPYEPMIPAGQRLILAESTGEPQIAMLAKYYLWASGSYWWILENYIRHFKGSGAPTFYKWTADPQGRGWGVTYQSFIWATFVHNFGWGVWWSYQPVTRWNLWYQGEVRMIVTGGGDLNDAAFRAWVESHDSRFGLTYEPRYFHCNDAMLQCAGEPKALGDVIAPLEGVQEEASDPENSDTPCPCIGADLGASYWYVADRPQSGAGSEIPPSYHPVVGVPQYPETGLIHEITRTMLDRHGNETAEKQHGWGVVQLSTGIPRVHVVGGGSMVMLNEIQQIIIECGEETLDSDSELLVYLSGAAKDAQQPDPIWIWLSATITETNRDANQTWIGTGPTWLSGAWPGNPPLTVTKQGDYVWQFEWINDEAETNHPVLVVPPENVTLKVNGIERDFPVRVVTIQQGGLNAVDE